MPFAGVLAGRFEKRPSTAVKRLESCRQVQSRAGWEFETARLWHIGKKNNQKTNKEKRRNPSQDHDVRNKIQKIPMGANCTLPGATRAKAGFLSGKDKEEAS